MNASEADTITLVGGLTVPVSALRLAWDLEARGLRLRADEDGGLLVGPSTWLTSEDRQAIASEKPYLLALVRYVGQRVN